MFAIGRKARESRRAQEEMAFSPKTQYVVTRFLDAPVIGERCHVIDEFGIIWETSQVVQCQLNRDGSGMIETLHSVYTVYSPVFKPAKKTVYAGRFLTMPHIGERCDIELLDGRIAHTSTVLGMSLQEDGSGNIETQNSIYVVEPSGTMIASF